MTDIEFPQQQNRLLEQCLDDAERVIEDRDHTIDRMSRENENLRRRALKFGDYERPEVVAEALEPILRRWPRERRQALADLITRI